MWMTPKKQNHSTSTTLFRVLCFIPFIVEIASSKTFSTLSDSISSSISTTSSSSSSSVRHGDLTTAPLSTATTIDKFPKGFIQTPQPDESSSIYSSLSSSSSSSVLSNYESCSFATKIEEEAPMAETTEELLVYKETETLETTSTNKNSLKIPNVCAFVSRTTSQQTRRRRRPHIRIRNQKQHSSFTALLQNDDALKNNDLVDSGLCIEMYTNGNRTYPIRNDLFEGELMVLLRDNPMSDYDFDGEEDVYFELQIQGRFKRNITGPLYLALGLPQTTEYKVAFPLRAVLNVCISFIKSMGYKWVHLSYGGKGDTPQIAIPAFQAFDRIVITPSHKTPPPLGQSIPEQLDFHHTRKRFECNHSIVDTSLTYTFSFNNTYLHPIQWTVNRMPIVNSFSLTKFSNVLRLSVYELIHVDGKVVEDTGGDVQAVAKGKHHTRRNHLMWIQLCKQQQI